MPDQTANSCVTGIVGIVFLEVGFGVEFELGRGGGRGRRFLLAAELEGAAKED